MILRYLFFEFLIIYADDDKSCFKIQCDPIKWGMNIEFKTGNEALCRDISDPNGNVEVVLCSMIDIFRIFDIYERSVFEF